jgi:hypothetical protein
MFIIMKEMRHENLHVVWEHDTKFTESGTRFRTQYVVDTITNYQALMSPKAWILVKAS